MLLAPAFGNSIPALNLNVNVIVAKWLRLELFLMEFKPGFRSVNLKAGEEIGIWHLSREAVGQ